MFEIDLLNGKGLPRQVKPGIIIAKTIPFVLPLLVLAALAVWFINGQAALASAENEVSSLTSSLAPYKGQLETVESVNAELGKLKGTLKLLDTKVGAFEAFTPVLVSIVNNLPESVIIEELSVDRDMNMARIKDGKKDKQVMLVDRKLTITVYGPVGKKTDDSIQKFVSDLRADPTNQTLKDIRIVTTREDEYEGKKVSCYSIDYEFQSRQ